ncbi:MAG: hypothetical protein HKN43_12700 [Rhodothermales bacterium]|nr:hypothetical protein [Rhodothermales bacterium]
MNDESHIEESSTNGNSVFSEFSELRDLLLEPEHNKLERADERLKRLEDRKVDVTVDQVSHLLPEAIVHRSKQDQKLASALAPTVEKTIQVSVRRDPRPIVDAIFPIIGPAIRKSIAEALSSTLESINQSMEHRFSLTAIKWRLEARRSGRTFSEVALSHTLLYRIEEIFVIDRQTGVSLVHVSTEAAELHDGSVVSSMLTAIQDFVKDSFGSEEDEVLETLEVGDVNVWFEPGPHATVAAVIRGIPPRSLRDHLKELVEVFHLNYADELATFEGDVDPFQGSVAFLTSGLLEQKQEREKKTSPLLWLFLIAAICVLGWLIYRGIDARSDKNNLLDALDSQPGIVVTDSYTKSGYLYVNGLKDPLSRSVEEIVSLSDVNPERIVFDWEPYHTLSPDVVRQRAIALLEPPATVELMVDDGVVFASGFASTSWIELASEQAKYLAPTVLYNDVAVVHLEDIAIADARDAIESLWVGFAFGSSDIAETELARIDRLTGHIASLSAAAEIRDIPFAILVLGGASGNADAATNRLLMDERSDSVSRALVARGIDPALLVSQQKSEESNLEYEDVGRARSVELRVQLGARP